MAALSEQTIVNNAYYLLEQDSEVWETDSSEYLTARGLANIAIDRWEKYDNTTWKELITKLADAADGTKTVTAGTYSYSTPTNFVRPLSFVKIGDKTFDVIEPQKLAQFKDSVGTFCYFTGNAKAGFKLNINPNLTLTTGDTIEYEYVKAATKFAATGDTTEMSDPYFISYFIAAHMGEEGIDPNLFDNAEARLDQMRTMNMSGLWGVANTIDSSFDNLDGFGI